jgi:hypothetical protein
MRVSTYYFTAVIIGLLLSLLIACGDPARAAFEEAARIDQQQQQLDAATKYLAAHEKSPSTEYGQLAKVRAEILLLELGAQRLQGKQWSELAKAADSLLEMDPTSAAGNIYKSYVLFEEGDLAEAAAALEKAQGELRGVSPPTKEAITATAKALFDGAEAGARSSLEVSVVDEQFLKNARARLNNKLSRERQSVQRRSELLAEGTLEAMATLLDNYADSPEATKVRGPYAQKVAAKLASVEAVGPPTVEDPDPITTHVDALKLRAPDEEVSKQALSKVKALRSAWETQYEEQLETIDEQVAEHQAKAMDQIATIIREKCAPARSNLNKGVEGAAEALSAAREEAAKLVPNGLTPEDLQEVSLYIMANCTPTKQ